MNRGKDGESVNQVLTGSVIGWTLDEIPEGYELIDIPIPEGGGTTDYEQLNNKPKIEGIELMGNKTLQDLSIQALTNFELEELINSQV